MQFRRMLSFHTFTVYKRIMGWGIPVKYLGCTNFLGGHNLGPGAQYIPGTLAMDKNQFLLCRGVASILFTPLLTVLFIQCCKIRRIARFSKLHFTSKQQELLGQYLQHPRTVKIGFCSLLGSTVNIVLQGQGYDLLGNLCNLGTSQESPSP